MEQKNERPIDRIRQLAEWLTKHNIIRSKAKFEEVCGLSRHYLKNLSATEKGNPGVDTIASIYEVFPTVNLKWLVTGKGSMFTIRNESELVERMILDMVSKEVLAATNEESGIRDVLKRALLDHKDDLSAEAKISILEKLL